MLTEADTCTRFVFPKLKEAGWDNQPHFFREQHTFTDGRIVLAGHTSRRRPKKRADFLLDHTRDVRGARIHDEVPGSRIGSRVQTIMRADDLIVSRIDARNGAMAIVPKELDGAIARNDFPVLDIDQSQVLPRYLRLTLFQPTMLRVYEQLSTGSTNRLRLEVERLLELNVPLHNLDEQARLTEILGVAERSVLNLKRNIAAVIEELGGMMGKVIHEVFKL